jgi:hypothetical protein
MKSIIERLRDYNECHDGDIAEAADMLEIFLSQMRTTSLHMDGQHYYHLRASGWPMTHAIGPSAEDAMRAVVAEVRRSKNEGVQSDEGKSDG